MQKKNIPNILSVARILLVPIFVMVYFLGYPENIGFAIVVFFLAGATDVVDGYLARRNNWITDVGKLLDPLADKMMQCAALTCFYITDIIPLWLYIAYVAKELLLIAGAIFMLSRRSVVVKSGFWGKVAVCVFYACVGALVFIQRFSEKTRLTLTALVCVIMLCFAIVALVQYFREYIKVNYKKQTL